MPDLDLTIRGTPGPAIQALAVAKIQEYLRDNPGLLRFITANHVCQPDGIPNAPEIGALRRIDMELAPWDQAACDAFLPDVKQPGHFELHDITELTGPNPQGFYTLHTAEGDTSTGLPYALVKRATRG